MLALIVLKILRTLHLSSFFFYTSLITLLCGQAAVFSDMLIILLHHHLSFRLTHKVVANLLLL